MASKLRILLLSSGVLLFVTVALTVALLIYAPSWLGNQKQVVLGKAENDDNMLSACARSGGQQASPTRRANGKIAFTQSTTNRGIYVINVHRDIYVIDDEGIHEKRLTHTRQLLEENPVWSPDGQKIAFATATDTRFPTGISVINADGTRFRRNEVSLISGPFSGNWEDQAMVGSPVWSPDGERIAFAGQTLREAGSAEPESANPAEGSTGIYLINVDGTGLCKLTSTAWGGRTSGLVARR